MDHTQFIKYALDFYGAGGIYDMSATRAEVTDACLIRLTDPRFSALDWAADSVDREIVRDIMIERRAAQHC